MARTAAAAAPPTDDETRSGPELIKAAADGESLAEQEAASATSWLLSDAPEEAPIAEDTVDINVGTDDAPNWIRWKVRAITPDELRRAQSAAARAARVRKGEPDELDYHAKVLAIGSVDPDIKAICAQKGATSQSDFLKARFDHKPGLIPQLTARIMSLSGFDDAHVREVEAGKL